MAGNEICCTVKLDEDDWKAIERAIMTIEKRLERIEAILDARGLDWDHPRVDDDHFADADKMVSDEPAKERAEEPPKKWRILEPGEVVCSSDWICARSNLPSDPPNGLGWRPVDASVGTLVCQDDQCIFARLVADEPAKEPVGHLAVPRISPGEWLDIRDAYRDATPADVGKLVYVRNGELQPWIELRLAEVTGANFPYRCSKDGLDPSMWQAFRYACIRNVAMASDHFAGADKMVADEPAKEPEPEHPAGPMPDPGEGYRILSKDPLEDLTPGDEFEDWNGKWIRSSNAETDKKQGATCWYRRKIETAEPPEPEYREPVLPADCGRICEFSSDGNDWTEAKLQGYAGCFWISVSSEAAAPKIWDHARIKKDA